MYQDSQELTSYAKDVNGQDIGNMSSIGYFESNTYEWLALRQSGIGGSDMNAICDKGGKKFRRGGR